MGDRDSKFPIMEKADLVKVKVKEVVLWFNTGMGVDSSNKLFQRRFPPATIQFHPTNAVPLDVVRFKNKLGRSGLRSPLTTMTSLGDLILRKRTIFMLHDLTTTACTNIFFSTPHLDHDPLPIYRYRMSLD